MILFQTLLLKLIPLYVTIALGYTARKVHTVERDSIAKVLLYLVVPFVFFSGAMHTPITLSLMFTPVITFIISSALCIAFFTLGKKYWQDSTANLLALTAGNANTGYFGLPVAMMLFDSAGVGIYLTIMIGIMVYESTIGFFITARGQYTAREAIVKLLRLPSLYAFALGLALQAMGFTIPVFCEDFFTYMRGCYSILGMMVIGMGLAGVTIHHIDWRFIGFSFLAKFVCYPLITALLVGLDATFLHLFSEQIHKAFLLISIMPLAANAVVYATLLGAQPEKAASSVFMSTIFALVYVPLMAALLVK